MATKADKRELANLRNFARMFNCPPNPIYLDCVRDHDEKYARITFQKVNRRLRVAGVDNGLPAPGTPPGCRWYIWYQKKIVQDLGDGSKSIIVPPPDKLQDETFLTAFNKEITEVADKLNMQIMGQKEKTNYIVVEFFPKRCKCKPEDFDWTLSEKMKSYDQDKPINDVDRDFSNLNIHN